MDNKLYNLVLAEYKNRLSDNTLGEIELKALLILEQDKNAQLQAKVTELEALLAKETEPAKEGE